MLDRYCYTDTHSEALEEGTTLLQKWVDRADVKTLDISKDPIQQDFQEGAYELIIASGAFHGTSSIDESLANLRKLLKPRGRLVLVALPIEDGRDDIASSKGDWYARLSEMASRG